VIYPLITAPILRPIPPPLVDAPTIKSRLAEHGVHLIMRRTKPPRERSARTHVRRAPLHARAEVARAVGARVEFGEGVEELEHVGALGRRGGVWVVGGGGVEERPGCAA